MPLLVIFSALRILFIIAQCTLKPANFRDLALIFGAPALNPNREASCQPAVDSGSETAGIAFTAVIFIVSV